MTDELFITASPYGTRAAAIAEGEPVAFFIESAGLPSRIGDLHLARPLRRMRGIGACVVDIGDGEEAFLPAAGTAAVSGDAPFIVQITCDAYEGKRARVTRRPVLASRLAVFRPGANGLAFSRRLRAPSTRRALKAALAEAGTPGGALTIREAAAGVRPDQVQAAAAMLAARWRSLEAAARRDRAPRRLWDADGLLGRLLRDVAGPGATRIVIDDGAVLDRARGLAALEAPDLEPALIAHDPATPALPERAALPLFEHHDCAGRLAAALDPVVTLPDGARLTIEETRALSAIDVDTDRAAAAVARDTAAAAGREIRRRNLGGLIAIDFAGRGSARSRGTQITALKRALEVDRTPHRVLGVTAGGLVEVNRQRLGPSVREALTEPARDALGGRVPRLDAAAHDAAHAARCEMARGARRLTLRAAPALLDALAAPGGDVLERWLGAALTPVPDPALPRGRFFLERG